MLPPDALAATIGGLAAVAKRASPRATALAKRRATALGQNFLLDRGVLSKFAKAAGPMADTALVVEIGAGPGGLTAALLAAGAPRVVAIERDYECVKALQEGGLPAVAQDRLRLIHGDARKVGLAALCEEEGVVAEAARSVKVVGNLPFSVRSIAILHPRVPLRGSCLSRSFDSRSLTGCARCPLTIYIQVGTRLLVDWMPPDPRLGSFTLLFQKEVGERICAPVGSKMYGRLSVLVQAWATPRLLFSLGPKHFTPPPKVETAVLGIVPLTPAERLLPATLAPSLQAVTAAAFQQRRKMLRSSLAKIPRAVRKTPSCCSLFI
jgi:16S rRNA (adenine1518-N6/adenine1519-N6)-dimethyltransferase